MPGWTVHLDGRVLGNVDAPDLLEARRRALHLARSQGYDRGVAFFLDVRPSGGPPREPQIAIEVINLPPPSRSGRLARAWRVLTGKE